MKTPGIKAVMVATTAVALIIGATAQPVPKAIVVASEKFENAIRWTSPGVLRNLMYEYATPDYYGIMNGVKTDLYAEIEGIAQFNQMVKKVYSADSKIVSHKWLGKDIEVVYSLEMVALASMGGPAKPMRMMSLNRSIWTKDYGSWRMRMQETLKFSLTPAKVRKR